MIRRVVLHLMKRTRATGRRLRLKPLKRRHFDAVCVGRLLSLRVGIKEIDVWLMWMAAILSLTLQSFVSATSVETLVAELPVCSVTTQFLVVWAPASGGTPFSSTSPASDRRQKVEFQTDGEQPRSVEIPYGSSSRSSGITLTHRMATRYADAHDGLQHRIEH